MGFLETVLVAIGLAMDAFAVSVCKGLSMFKMNWKKAFTIAIYFGIFQMVMPLLGFLLGIGFSEWIEAIDHWIAFILLGFIGLNMIKNVKNDENESDNASLDLKTMTLLAIATSIDAFAVGVTFAFLRVEIIKAVVIIGIVTLGISAFGVIIGNKFGNKLQNKAELLGGVVLIIMGFKILLQHLNVI